MINRFVGAVAVGACALALSAATAAQHREHAHRHPAAATRKNPVAASPASIASGRAVFDSHCAECHGRTGKGNGPAGEGLDERPADFTDAAWEHGSTDGELFVVIRDGAGPKSEMEGFGKTLTDKQIWDVVNFLRTLGPAKNHP